MLSVGTCFWLSGSQWPFSSDASCTYGAAIFGFFPLAANLHSVFYTIPIFNEFTILSILISGGQFISIHKWYLFSARGWLDGWFGIYVLLWYASMDTFLISLFYLWTTWFDIMRTYGETLTRNSIDLFSVRRIQFNHNHLSMHNFGVYKSSTFSPIQYISYTVLS